MKRAPDNSVLIGPGCHEAPPYSDEPCRCNCGYTCDRKCGLGILDCMQKHYKSDCDHVFEGWEEFENGGTTVCKHCGMRAIDHDMRFGP